MENRDYVIVTDTTTDMGKDYYRENNIPYVALHYIMDDKEYVQYAENGIDIISILYNNAYYCDGKILCGTRGWILPQNAATTDVEDARHSAVSQDEKLYRREAMRLEMSLKEAQRIAQGRPIVAMMHYPPLLPENAKTGTAFTALLSQYGVARCVYGHLHGPSHGLAVEGLWDGVDYKLVSADYLNFEPYLVIP